MKQQKFKLGPGVLLFLWVLGALTGCIHKTETGGTSPHPPQIGTFYLIVHAPDVLVVKERGVMVLVPWAPGHEQILPYPVAHKAKPVSAACKSTTHFELLGVESANSTAIDSAFGPVTFNRPDWKQNKDEDVFVTMKLPLPIRIDALGPLQAVQFESDPDRIEYVPLTQVLEFRTRDIKKVQLVQTEISSCGTEKSSQTMAPLSCQAIQQHYDDYWTNPDNSKEEHSERAFLIDLFRRCADSGFLFIGVGLHPNTFSEYNDWERRFAESGRDFFNTKLLPLVFESAARVPPEKKLKEIVVDKKRIVQWTKSPKLLSAVYKGTVATPLPVVYASTENCKSPGTVVTTTH